MINQYFDNVYCINLRRRPEKRLTMQRRFDNLSIHVQWVDAIDGDDLSSDIVDGRGILNRYEVACQLSHKLVIEDAKKNGYKRILVFEDDVLFSHDFSRDFEDIIARLGDWRLLYLGASQYLWPLEKYAERVLFANETLGAFAYAVDCRAYDVLLEKVRARRGIPFDRICALVQKSFPVKSLVVFPYLVIADVSSSDLRAARDMVYHSSKMRWDLADFL